MTVEVTEVKEIHIAWGGLIAIIRDGHISGESTIGEAERVEADPQGFAEFAQRIADALIQSKPKEPRRHRKDKGTKRGTGSVDVIGKITPMIVTENKERMNLTAFTTDELAVLTTPEQNQEKVYTGPDIFRTFEMRTPEPRTNAPYIFRMGGKEVMSKTMKEGATRILLACAICPDELSAFPASPQLQQIKDILFPKEVKNE